MRPLAILLVVVSLLSGCAVNPPTPATDPTGPAFSPGGTESSSPSTANPPVEVSPIPVIRTAPSDGPGTEISCAGVGMAAILKGDPADPRVAWLEHFPSGPPRIEIIWPAGFTARFAPDLEILDPMGHVAIRGGDFVDGACVTGEQDVIKLYPSFLALRLECGPMPIPECGSAQLFQIATVNGWPEREIAELRFLSADGRYVMVFEDGGQASGVYTPN
jgi:hypothetical protein